jgi:hypothetical protein
LLACATSKSYTAVALQAWDLTLQSISLGSAGETHLRALSTCVMSGVRCAFHEVGLVTFCVCRSVVISVRSADKGEQAVADIKGVAQHDA